MTSPATLRVGVIGTGHWGKNLLRNFDALGALTAFCDASEAMLAPHRDAYPQARAGTDPKALIDADDIDAVVIAAPAAEHGALARAALDAGKHVFVEKPLCLDLAEANDLIASADAKGLTLMVGHLLLYHPAFMALREFVAAGRLGRLRYIYSNRASLGKIRREENALWSFAPHDVSMILALMGRMPETVVANGGSYLHSGVSDTTLTHLTFEEGLQAHIFVSWLHPFKDHKLVVVGEAGMVVFDDTKAPEEKLLFYGHDVRWDGDVPVVSKANATPITFEWFEPLRNECATFLSCVSERTRPLSDGAEGRRVLAVLDACQRALASGQPVSL